MDTSGAVRTTTRDPIQRDIFLHIMKRYETFSRTVFSRSNSGANVIVRQVPRFLHGSVGGLVELQLYRRATRREHEVRAATGKPERVLSRGKRVRVITIHLITNGIFRWKNLFVDFKQRITRNFRFTGRSISSTSPRLKMLAMARPVPTLRTCTSNSTVVHPFILRS